MEQHDLLQCYVQAPIESLSYSKSSDDSENHYVDYSPLGPIIETESTDDVPKERRSDNKKQRNGKSGEGTIESEVDIQKRRKKHRQNNGARQREEVYTDKDRAAAVNMGTRDIKQSLKLKQKEDRGLQLSEDTKPIGLVALGLREMQIGNMKLAMDCINKALDFETNDSNALIARSKCYLLLGEAKKALEDAENALQFNMNNANLAKAIYSKAEALYHLGHFEMSLVYYYRGMKIRSECEQFRIGVQKAIDAIQNVLCKK